MTEREPNENPFFRLHRGLLREGPGDSESTARALFSIPALPYRPRVLDLGCGPGTPTLDLARLLPSARITAVDLHQPFLDVLDARAAAEGFRDRISTVRGDLRDPPVTDPADLIWAEGSAYLFGFERAMLEWPTLLTNGGAIALTEPVKLVDPLPTQVAAVWADYPDLQPIEVRRKQVAQAGLVLHDLFVLDPETAWRPYYDPLQSRIHDLRPGADEALVAVLDEAQAEIDAFWAHPEAVGYAFFVVGRPEPVDEA
ncbi:MAG: class I SAM-dependent methyltransferase [Myxococcota bacterium]